MPADAEVVIEGYLDEHGYREMDGPYGEFWGYYGAMHIDPVIHVTAITMRRDALHHTVLHGPVRLSRQEASHTTGGRRRDGFDARAEGRRHRAGCHLLAAVRADLPSHARGAGGCDAGEGARGDGGAVPGQGRQAHHDRRRRHRRVRRRPDHLGDGTRFNADKDLFIPSRKLQAFYADPNADADGLVSKVGFDLTSPTSKSKRCPLPSPAAAARSCRPRPTPACSRRSRRGRSISPISWRRSAARTAARSRIELDALREAGTLTRLDNGEYALLSQTPGAQRAWTI